MKEKPYTPVPLKRNCGEGPGATHWMGCECHEALWKKQVDELKKANWQGAKEYLRLVKKLQKIAAYCGRRIKGDFFYSQKVDKLLRDILEEAKI